MMWHSYYQSLLHDVNFLIDKICRTDAFSDSKITILEIQEQQISQFIALQKYDIARQSLIARLSVIDENIERKTAGLSYAERKLLLSIKRQLEV